MGDYGTYKCWLIGLKPFFILLEDRIFGAK
jgi:hypothetical protein